MSAGEAYVGGRSSLVLMLTWKLFSWAAAMPLYVYFVTGTAGAVGRGCDHECRLCSVGGEADDVMSE